MLYRASDSAGEVVPISKRMFRNLYHSKFFPRRKSQMPGKLKILQLLDEPMVLRKIKFEN